MADGRLSWREPDGGRQPAKTEPGLGEVARHALDHAQEIARDSLAIGKLEAKRAGQRAVARTREVAPRVGYVAAAGVLGLVGVVLGLIAVFIGLGEIIPSVGWRLFIYAVAFLAAAGLTLLLLSQRKPKPQRVSGFQEGSQGEERERVMTIVPRRPERPQG